MMPSGPAGKHGALIVEPAHQHGDAACRAIPSTLSSGTSQSSNTSSQVLDPRMPSLSSFWRGGEALETLLDDECGDATRAGAWIGLGVNNQ